MTIKKQCSSRIMTIQPDGQHALNRILAVQTALVLDPDQEGYDQSQIDLLVSDVLAALRQEPLKYERAEVYSKD